MSNQNNVELIIKPTLPKVDVNFEELEAHIDAQLEKYDGYVVTAETEKADKKLAAEIKGFGSDIDKARKEKKSELTAPIKEWEEKMNTLRDKYFTCSATISSQVSEFEAVRLNECEELLIEYRDSEYERLEVKPEFRKADITKYKLLGSLTAKGALNKKAKDGVDSEVNKDLALQAKIEGRIASLESECFKAGLTTPLSEHHISGFLYENTDFAFGEKLKAVINAEVERNAEIQRKADAAAQLKAEHELQAAQMARPQVRIVQDEPYDDSAQNEVDYNGYQPPEEYQLQQEQDSVQQQPVQQQEQPSNKVQRIVDARFQILVPDTIPFNAIEDRLRLMLEKAGITSLVAVKVRQ